MRLRSYFGDSLVYSTGNPGNSAVAEIADRTFRLFRHLCCTAYGIAKDRCLELAMFSMLSMATEVEILGLGSLRAQGGCRG